MSNTVFSASLQRLSPGRLAYLRPFLLAFFLLNGVLRLGLAFAALDHLSWRVLPALFIGAVFDLGVFAYMALPLALLLVLWPKNWGKALHRCMVLLTEALLPYPHHPASIAQDQVDLIVQIDQVGDADKIGADATSLTLSMQAYNAAIGQPAADALHPSDPLGKAADMCQALEQAPFYAIDISVTSPYLPMASITLGGLQVNEETGQVKNREGLSIDGLYAAGRTAVGIASSRYMSGLSLADCIFSGRRAAQHAAQIKVKP